MLTISLTCLLLLLSSGLAKEICSTSGCLEIADTFKKSMDLAVNPCDDFYQFTCGNFIRNSSIYDGEVRFGSTEKTNHRIRLDLKSELEAETLDGQPPALQIAKDYYYSCMDTKNIEKYSLKKMKARLTKYGGWPVLETNWDETNFNWINTTKKLKSAGHWADQIVSIYVDVSEDDSSKRIVIINSGHHDLSPSLLQAGLVEEEFQTYFEVLVNMSVALGADLERAKQDMWEVVQFEVALINLTLSDVQVSKVPSTIGEMEKAWPYIPWLDLVHTYIGHNLNITNKELVTVYDATYFEGLGSLLSKTSKRLLANYILTQEVFNGREYLNQQIHNISQRLDQVRYGTRNLPERWDFCLRQLYDWMDVALGATYIRKHFSPASKQKAQEITNEFKGQFIKIINNEDWMDSITKSRAIKKVENITLFIGYPDELLNDTIINELYKDLKICRRDIYGNTLAFIKWSRTLENQKLRQPVDPLAWDEQALREIITVDSQYETESNVLDIFAAILQEIFFSRDRPPFLNYGTLSSVIAYEMTNSVGTKGNMYDEHGNLKNWWTESSNEGFQKKAKALADEYSTYVVKELKLTLNGTAIQEVIIADQGGYKIARLALDSWLVGKKGVSLAGMEKYTAQQLFWLGAASTWCTKEKPEFLRSEVLNGEYPPAEVRVNGPFRQSVQFSIDWSCPSGSYMNPENKFNVW